MEALQTTKTKNVNDKNPYEGVASRTRSVKSQKTVVSRKRQAKLQDDTGTFLTNMFRKA